MPRKDPIELLRKAVILTGPSGAGKNTLGNFLLEHIPQIAYSVSACSRQPRHGEHHGTDYYFVPREEFLERIDNDEFVEWEEVFADTYYGTLKSEVDRIWQAGKAVLFVVDVVGARHLKEYFLDNSLSIFIQAPSLEANRKRLVDRGSESPQEIERRLAKAVIELESAHLFDRILINGDLSTSEKEIVQIVKEFLGK